MDKEDVVSHCNIPLYVVEGPCRFPGHKSLFVFIISLITGNRLPSASLPSLEYNESESEVAQSCPTLCDPMDYSLSGSSVHGIFQARVLDWVAILQGTFPTQGSNPGLPHCRQTLYQVQPVVN